MCVKRFFCVMLLAAAVTSGDCGKGKHRSNPNGRQGLRFLKTHRGIGTTSRRAAPDDNTGLWPPVFNLATKAVITANATCGQMGREDFCRLSDNGRGRCGQCDNDSVDTGKRHSIGFVIDGSNRWWQSPALYYGPEYEFVTITIDLKQVYQIAFITIKMANSPRPGTWVLERSLDGERYEPWQYFTRSDKECLEMFGVPATKGKPHYFTDFEVICTSFYSRLTPLENGEIHTSLINGRPGANETSPELLEFTKARYVRIRLMGLRGNQEPVPKWLTHDVWRDKKLFYSIRDISIGGQCVCNGHAEECRHNVASGHPECECGHNTCGPNCDRCCPMFNQRQWGPASARDARRCLPCNCHGHAASCHYDVDVDRAGLSMDVAGNYQGGGVCDNCTDFTTGINCDKCLPGYYRPPDTAPEDPNPCRPCRCPPPGAAGACEAHGAEAGQCRCESGYAGEKCDRCEPGHRGFPACEPCPCDVKGVAGAADCEGECICKVNVEGKYCDRCKSGHFGLRNDIAEGCLPCYCSGVTTLCESAIVKPKKIESLQDWLITDLQVTKSIKPNWNGQGVFSLGTAEFPGIKSLYWLAPEHYMGNKLTAYNADFVFMVQWVVMRGDTSGEPTRGPNIVLIGSNGMKIAYGDDVHDSSTMRFQIKFNEVEWYHVMRDVTDITRLDSSNYHGRPVTRGEFLSILTDVKYILLRSTFHTDQIESLLEEASLVMGDEEDGYSSIERCSCPSGYTGLSCESCAFGFARITPNISTPSFPLSSVSPTSFCAKCDCNGHSATCNPTTGECFCEHSTLGEKCERCAPGHYGNPLRGTPEDCRRCACPMVEESNNFSPSCQLDYSGDEEGVEDEGGYVCTQCPKGYTGDHCEVCDDGFFGNPMEIRNTCQPCDCNGGPCDRMTGQCLSCKGNTEGWKCEKCKPDHYGEPSLSNCKACECDPIGSISKQCDINTGQCECKDKFVGRTCDKCEVGFGNVTAFCVPCSCNTMGSKSGVCDTHTGTCDCQPGVEGFHCDACQNLYYGFSETGCQPCTCDPDGAKFPMCDVNTGSCVCNPHFTSHHCDICEEGYWKNQQKCDECKCNKDGTKENTHCDRQTGKCHCKLGVTGARCDSCMPDHYGTIESGCKKCDLCNKKGHICDPENGKCVCPPLTLGAACETCAANAYGYEPDIGCKACNCSTSGSANQQCDHVIGRCTCKIGYEGEKCNRCSYGFYGYPRCQKCSCHPAGTLDGECQNGLCQCDAFNGSCQCKENVEGHNCDRCKKNHYGLTKENPKGCTGCFCFGRSEQCEDAHYHWSKTTRLARNDEDNQVVQDELMLPRQFLGDLTSSYGGYLEVQVPGAFFDIYLDGNGISLLSAENKNELQMVETSKWLVSSRNPDFPNSCIDNMSRACFMVVLEKVTSIRVQAKNRIKEVLLDKANDVLSYAMTHSIENCECPQEYSGLSCQNPNRGYFRYFPRDPTYNWIDNVVGIAKPCECGGHSKECDPESGHCKNCTDHTTGNHCENCDVGFYKDKNKYCTACLCPSADQNNAKSCSSMEDGFTCECKDGYKGKYCDQCDINYYMALGSKICQPCGCNRFGTVTNLGSCDQYGKCNCKFGFKGIKCDQCVKEREYIENGVCKTCDECTMKLFDKIDEMKKEIEGIFASFKKGIGPPWKKLTDDIGKLDRLSEKFYSKKESIEDLLKQANIDLAEKEVSGMEEQLLKNNKLAQENVDRTEQIYKNSTTLLEETEELSKKLMDIISSLDKFGTKQVNLKEALKRAELILKEIQDESKRLKQQDENIFAQCEAINKKVENIYKPSPIFSNDKLKELKKKLQDLINIVSFVENLAKLADSMNTENSKRIEKVREKIEILKNKNKNVHISLGDIVEKTEAVEEMMQQLSTVYEDLKEISEFHEFTELENRVKRHKEDIPKIEELYSQAIDHVQDLENTINHYHSMFNFTKDEWKKINASGAYEAIINGIKQARDSVKESEEVLINVIKILNPDDADNLFTKTNLAHAYSDRLKQRINNLKNISKNLMEIKNKLDDLKYNILENGKSNNDLTQILHKINKNITSQSDRVVGLEEAMRNASQVSENMRDLEKQLGDMNFNKQFILSKNYQNYVAEMDGIGKFTTKLIKTRGNLEELNFLPPSSNAEGDQQGIKLQNLEAKIKMLQNNIKEAKQQVDVIDVAMNLTNCKMFYKRPEPEYFHSLTIKFRCQNCILFRWIQPASSLTLSVENYMPKLNYSVKNSKPTLIRLNDSSKIERTIKLSKECYFLKLQLENETFIDQQTTTFEKILKIGRDGMAKISTDDILEVGSTDMPALNAYVHKIFLNDNNFGLWNFYNISGTCGGQRRDTTTDDTSKNIFFNGEGYQKYGTNNLLKPGKLALKFSFQTFDENNTIYVAENSNEKCSFIYLYLLSGCIHLTMLHEDGQNITINSKTKVNDAKFHSVEVGLEYLKSKKKQVYSLTVDKDEPVKTSRLFAEKNIFKIKKSQHYMGGVSPTFNRICTPVKTNSFLGFLKQTFQLGNERVFYGIRKTSKDTIEFNRAWINKNGFLNIKMAEEELKSLSFILRPDSADGVIMKFGDGQNISLENWNIVVNGINKHNHQLTRSVVYCIELRLEDEPGLTIDDHELMSLVGMNKILVNQIQIGDHKNGFSGGIRYIMINNKSFTFSAISVESFSNVEIGREKPLVEANINMRSLTMLNLTNSMQNTEGCVDFDSYNPEVDAVKYGDKPNSFTYMKTNFWKTNYTLRFDFRTLFPNGVLFLSSNKKMNYILLGLREGQLYLTIKRGKKKAKSLPISSYQKVNDGQWHNLRITRKMKKLSVILDQEKQPSRINFRIKPKDEIYFGGVPSNSAYTMVGDLFDKLQPFRGCMRNLSINNEQKLLIKNSKEIKHSGITQCFSNVEDGAYFGGDAYAIYKDDFRVGEPVELSFEFRTSEQNGVLLSISNDGDSPALSVELQNGAIVMAVDNGNGIVSNVTNNLDSDFSLCNNRWHNVTALYSSSELTVNVDGIRKSWVVSDLNSTIDEVEAPLYVGGLPGNAPTGTLKSLTNFKGCLRKLMIENHLVDWSGMKEFNNVLLNSCPVNQDS